MRNKPIQADQLIPTSSTPPPEAGFYRIDRHIIGVVGNMSFRDPDTQVVMPVGKCAIPFPDFTPRLLASLVASSTAACTSGVVTVTAASHGIPETTFDGYSFYYPGSASLAAGWYSGFARASADAVTFLAPIAPDFTSESVNSGAAFTSEATMASVKLPGNSARPGDLVTALLYRQGDGVSAAKTVRLKVNTTSLALHATSTASINGASSLTFAVVSPSVQSGSNAADGAMGSVRLQGGENMAADSVVSVTGQLAQGGQFFALAVAKLVIR